MQVAYLIGNGFDIALGLKTRYLDFYEHYVKCASSSDLIRDFKKELEAETKGNDKWSDLELALGEYLEKLSSLDQFDEILDDIQVELSEYLKLIQNSFKTGFEKEIETKKFLQHLLCPEDFLKGRNSRALKKFYSSISSKPFYFNVISFNYTNTFEQILGISEVSNEYANLTHRIVIDNVERMLRSLFHVHGSVTEDMVIGVNDEDQISNLEFRKNRDIRTQFIKSECNLAQGHGVEESCMERIKKADVICIFGSSLGKTDKIWWDLIADQVRERSCRLVIFDYQPSFKKLQSARGDRYKRIIIEKIFGNNQPNDVEEKVLVSLNSDLFKKELF